MDRHKNKAIELVNRFRDAIGTIDNGNSYYNMKEEAKECALLCLDLIIEETENIYKKFKNDVFENSGEFKDFTKLKIEIEQLKDNEIF